MASAGRSGTIVLMPFARILLKFARWEYVSSQEDYASGNFQEEVLRPNSERIRVVHKGLDFVARLAEVHGVNGLSEQFK